MCKILTLTNISKIKSLSKTVNEARKCLAEYEGDGFGYSIQSSSGAFGERSLDTESFKFSFNRSVSGFPFAKPRQNKFGTRGALTGAAMFHGRTSTNDKTLGNTHPINKHGWSLIHNGVVTNHGSDYKMDTTNDTEHVVQLLATEGIRAIEQHLTGYYAVTALDPQGHLHVIRDATASLYACRIDSIDSILFGTTEALIQEFCDAMDWIHSTIEEVDENIYMIFNGNTMMHHEPIKPRGRTSYENNLAHLSLGKSLTNLSSEVEAHWGTAKPVDEPLSESEKLFLEEVSLADASYSYKDYYGRDLSFDEFSSLDFEDKLYCTVIRGDGTIVCPIDYHQEKLYQGAV